MSIRTKTFLLTLVIALISFSQISFSQDSTEVSTQQAKEVIEKYLQAIGGRDLLASVEDRTTIMRGTAMGTPLTIVVKQKAPNKMRQEIKAGGMDQNIIFDGEKGVMKAAGQNVNIEGKELEQLKIEATMELLLDPEAFGIKMSYVGIDSVGTGLADEIKFVLPSGLRWFLFFDNETGLKLKETKEMQTQMGLFEQTLEYSDYQDVEGLKFPFKLKQSFGPQEVEITVSSIKINKGIEDSVFAVTE